MPEILYTCTVCQQTFSDEDSLKDHMVVNHSTKQETYTEGETK